MDDKPVSRYECGLRHEAMMAEIKAVHVELQAVAKDLGDVKKAVLSFPVVKQQIDNHIQNHKETWSKSQILITIIIAIIGTGAVIAGLFLKK